MNVSMHMVPITISSHDGDLCTQLAVLVQVTYSIHTVRVELYESAGDYVRLVLEILLTIWVSIQMLTELWAVIQAKRRQVLPLAACHLAVSACT